MAAQTQARWLLIGNTRWHWAANAEQGLACWHTPPPAQGWTAGDSLAAWAAVGAVPDQAGLDPARRIDLGQVPLQALPSWLGIDRALVAIENENEKLRGKLDKRFGAAQLEPGRLGELVDLISTIGFGSDQRSGVVGDAVHSGALS